MKNENIYRLIIQGDAAAIKNVGLNSTWKQSAISAINKQAETDFGTLVQLTKKTWVELLQKTTLDLSFKQLQSLPPDFSKLVNLRWLDLCYNQLQALPDDLSRLISLEWLDLRNNQIQALPAAFSSLVNLEVLEFRNNQISSIEQARIRKMLPNCKVYF